jgi:hypothetical protein
VKSVRLVPVPPGVVTETGPDVAPIGTVAWISISEVTENGAGVPWNFTDEAPAYPRPVIVTEVPEGPLEGLKRATVGGGEGVTTKSISVAPVPSASVTEIGPVVAPTGTIAVICVLESTVNDAASVPLKATLAATLESSKPIPVIVTDVPTGPISGEATTTTGAMAWAAGATARSAITSVMASSVPKLIARRDALSFIRITSSS